MRCQFPSCSSAGMKGKRHPVPLVSFTVVAPGPIKDSEVTRRIFNHGVTALRALATKQGWQIQEQAALVSASGPEGMLSIAAPARDLNIVILSGGYGISMS